MLKHKTTILVLSIFGLLTTIILCGYGTYICLGLFILCIFSLFGYGVMVFIDIIKYIYKRICVWINLISQTDKRNES